MNSGRRLFAGTRRARPPGARIPARLVALPVAALVALPIAALVATLVGCAQPEEDRPETAREFPRPYRPVSALGSNAFSTESLRDDRNEAQSVMDLAQIRPGMSVADIGAGDGYYTVRLAARVGPTGRLLANDIDQDALRRLGNRIEGERLDNVSIVHGQVDDPRLPEASFDRIFMVHMYHEVSEPYAFLWRMHAALAPGGQVIVVDTDRPSDEHGIMPQLLFCEFERVGYRLVKFVRKPEIVGYYAQFEVAGPRPEPRHIEPCLQPGKDTFGLPVARDRSAGEVDDV